MRLMAVNPVAEALGLAPELAPDLALADARARVPDLAVHDHDPPADANWLDRLARDCVRYTPMVAADPPAGLLLDITGCAHLFGGEEALARTVTARFEKLGMTVRPARGSTARAAHALARHGGGEGIDEGAAIRRLPVAALELDPESDLGLRRAGLKTVGAVADRPRAAIAARFGAAAVLALERLLGEADSPLDPEYRQPPIRVVRRFAEPVANSEYALAVLAELLAEAITELAKRDRGGRRFAALFHRTDGRTRTLRVETGLPTRDLAAIRRLFDERIETLTDPLDPGFGFDCVELAVPVTEPLAPSQPGLEGGTGKGREAQDGAVAELLDRLSTRFGRDRLHRFHPGYTHIPEQGQIAMPAVEAAVPMAWPAPEPGEPPARPLQLFDPPEPISVIAEVPDGPPYRFRWRRKLREVTRYEGPERIASEWWHGSRDPLGRTRLTRDYYRIEDVAGRRYWIFRHGLFGREKADPRWYLHGLFA
ncbi:DNA polymerase Y family protein [Parasphingopyxis algicola]|uniref:DNA polymerase Y family protein n=1 Tax=Parasphingopyxis algicola TaxID=2026624 RepID=UPI001FECA73A|nr:DNA polymerase Y family protein [Parasphingopyxis algicola]